MPVKAIAAASAVAVLVIAGCSSGSKSSGSASSATGSSSASSEPFRVTYVTSTSGVIAAAGAAQVASAKAAVQAVNSSGGILGRQIELTVVDDGFEPTRAVNAAQSIVLGSVKPDVVIAGAASSTAIPMLPIFAKANLSTVTLAAAAEANDPVKFPLSFGFTTTATQSIKGLVQHLKDTNITKVAVAVPNNATGQSISALLVADTKAAGITISGTQLITATTVDTTAALSALKATNPQELVVAGFSGAIVGSIFKDRAKLGWTVPTLTDVTTTAQDPTTLGGGVQNMQGVVEQEIPFAVKGDPSQSTPAFKQFSAAMDAALPNSTLGISAKVAGWSAIAFIQGEFNHAKSTDPATVAKANLTLQTKDAPLWFQTSEPTFGFTTTDHYPVYSKYVYAKAGVRDSTGSLVPGS